MKIINIYVLIKRPAKYMRQKLTESKGELDSSVITAGDITTLFFTMHRITRQKMSVEIDVNHITHQLELRGTYKTLDPTKAGYILLKCT